MREKRSWKTRWFWVLVEKHEADCTCSYCAKVEGLTAEPLHYGLNIPRAWKRSTSWWVIKYGRGKYFRWTNSWLRRWA